MIYLDIETASLPWTAVTEDTRELWGKFAENKYRNEPESPEKLWDHYAALHPEFGLIVCISYAIDEGDVHSLAVAEPVAELDALQRFAEGLRLKCHHNLCAHNGKGFDFHWLARRMVMHEVTLPEQLNTQGKKPWETQFADTQEMWGFGDLRRTVRLDVLCHSLGVPSPKDAMCGADVPQAWRDGRIDEIVTYCEKDVEALRKVYNRLVAA